jgi:hypothetical protein
MKRSSQSLLATLGTVFRTLFFLPLLLLLCLFLVWRLIPCIVCDLFDLCNPAPYPTDLAPRHGSHRATLGAFRWVSPPSKPIDPNPYSS